MNPQAVGNVGGSQAHTICSLTGAQFLYRAPGDFPVAKLKGRENMDPFVAEIRIFPFNFAPKVGHFAMGNSCR